MILPTGSVRYGLEDVKRGTGNETGIDPDLPPEQNPAGKNEDTTMAKKTAPAKEVETKDTEAQDQCSVDREKARAMFLALGIKTASKWDDGRLLGKLKALDSEDEGADPGKYAKLYARVIKANKDGREIVLTGDAEPAKAQAEKNGKASEKKGKTVGKGKGKKGGGGAAKGPGVIAKIAEILQAATAKKPITKEQIVAKLVKAFPDREESSMKGTVAVQVPSRIANERGIKVKKNDKGYYAG